MENKELVENLVKATTNLWGYYHILKYNGESDSYSDDMYEYGRKALLKAKENNAEELYPEIYSEAIRAYNSCKAALFRQVYVR